MEKDISKVLVNIKCSQVKHYNQDVMMSVIDYEKIKDLNFDGISGRHSKEREQCNILQKWIDFQDVYDTDDEFTNVDINLQK